MDMAEGSEPQIIDFNSLPNPVDKYELLEIIGEGTYGEVHLAVDLDSQNEHKVAIKILENLIENIEEAEYEYLVLKELSLHPNLPFFHGLYYHAPKAYNSQLWFVMEYCSGGSVTDLAQALRKYECRHLSELQLAYILHEVVDALLHLHNNKIIHRDVKGHNILLTEEGSVKLIDFGVSTFLKTTLEKRMTSVGTPFWMPPEVIACEHQSDISYDSRCDVWSLGITAIELAEGEPPLANLHPMRALFQIPRNPPPTLTKPLEWSSTFNEFITDCLIKNMQMRPWMSEIKKHPFISQLGPSTDGIRRSIVSELRLAKVIGVIRREPEVTTKHGKLKSDRKSALQTMFLDDLASLSTLDEGTILEQLHQRFEHKNIYTYVGDIFLAINPYEKLGIYSDFYQFKYRGFSTADVSPHIFGVADQAYHSMLHGKKDQVLVITGESGAGKTETAKYVLHQLVYLGKAPNRNLEVKILQLDPIMEAFGNAKTLLNNNSSRFAKYLNLTFTRTGKITGAEICMYMLESSRIIHQDINEANFHVFNYILDGLSAEGSENLSQLFRQNYSYIQNGRSSSPAIKKENVRCFQELQKGFHVMGFNDEEVFGIYEIIIAILHLGEIQFDVDANENNGCSVMNGDELKIVATLLGVSTGDMGVILTTKNITYRESFLQRNTIAEATRIRDSLAQELYSRLFHWIISQINALLGISCFAYGSTLAISILDIFGFVTNSMNSLEEFYINTTNELVQYYFNQNVFVWEQQEFKAQGIDIEVIKFADNKPILDLLLCQPLGIFSTLDEESCYLKSTDLTLRDKLDNNFGNTKYYRKSKTNGDVCFEVRHYAGRVSYNLSNFLVKNRRWTFPPDLIDLFQNSNNNTVRTLFRCVVTKTGRLTTASRNKSSTNESEINTLIPNTRKSVTLEFRHSMAELMSNLLATQPHFIRCINPNNRKLPNSFDVLKVLIQLRFSGIMDAIHIRQVGYSHRLTFVDFLKSYCFLGFTFDERVVADRESCRLLLLRLNMDGWALGKTKVFLRYYHVEYLSKLYEEQIRKIVFVQSCIRRWLTQVRLQKGMWMVAKQVVSIQKAAKVWRVHTTKVLGSNYRSRTDGKRNSWLRVQVLGMDTEVEEIKKAEEKAAILIQTRFRGFIVRKKWGPILEERIKEIISTHKRRESAKQALEAEGLDEEEAAQVLQRYYRRWKIAKENSLEAGSEEDQSLPPLQILVADWDAPFRLMEKQMRELRAGKKIKENSDVDIVAHRREMIQQGLASQKLKNEQRDVKITRGWQNVITVAQGETESPPEKKLSKMRKHLLVEALEQKIHNLREVPVKANGKDFSSKVSMIDPTPPPLTAVSSILCQTSSVPLPTPQKSKVVNRYIRTKSFEIDLSDSGQVDYRKLLRKTGYVEMNN